MWPFERKAQATQASSVTINMPMHPYRRYKYRDFVAEGWLRNPTASSCTLLIGRSIGRLPWRVVSAADDSDITSKHPATALLRRPRPGMGWGKFTTMFWQYYYYAGNVFVAKLGSPRLPVALWLLRPDRVEVVLNKDGSIMLYRYTVDGRSQDFPPEMVLHFKAPALLDDFYGEPPLSPAAQDIDAENLAKQWNNSLLINRGEPSLHVEAPEGMQELTKEQREVIQERMEKNILGAANVGRPMIWGGGVKVTPIAHNPKDMDWLGGITAAQVSIANVCDVPPELVGIQGQKTYSNYETAVRAFYTMAVLPHGDDMFQALTNWFIEAGDFGGGFRIEVDLTQVEEIQESQDAIVKRLLDGVGKGVKLNEVRESLGFDPDPAGNTILVNQGLVPIDMLGADAGLADEPYPINDKPDDKPDEEADDAALDEPL